MGGRICFMVFVINVLLVLYVNGREYSDWFGLTLTVI